MGNNVIKNNNQTIFRFITYSLIGIFMFFIPIQFNNK